MQKYIIEEVGGGKQLALQTTLRCFSLCGFTNLFFVGIVFHQPSRSPSRKFGLSPALALFLFPRSGLLRVSFAQLSLGKGYFFEASWISVEESKGQG